MFFLCFQSFQIDKFRKKYCFILLKELKWEIHMHLLVQSVRWIFITCWHHQLNKNGTALSKEKKINHNQLHLCKFIYFLYCVPCSLQIYCYPKALSSHCHLSILPQIYAFENIHRSSVKLRWSSIQQWPKMYYNFII